MFVPKAPAEAIRISVPLFVIVTFVPAVILTGLKSVAVDAVETRVVPAPPLVNV